MRPTVRYLTEAAAIGAAYVVLTLPFAQIAFGGPIQFRLAEALAVLPLLTPAAIPGLFLGCFLANLLNPQNLGPIDIIFGSLATLLAAWLTVRIKRSLERRTARRVWPDLLALLPPILVNALVVGSYLPWLLAGPGRQPTTWETAGFMLSIAASQAVVIVLIGYPLLLGLKRAGLKRPLH